ncbi:phosphotransferase enzyme family protein [Foetidibacter luteolus]|uniref:phosphotransferase enzyme family protein n=1 Tax=Foetidibacter luteolus TaxID=2608880 RepID=UPI00129A132F|nr:aminoglycoside phosphotransferase family protein [Foetidibacter luteolus]
MQPIIEQYRLDSEPLNVKAFGSGLINDTWVVETKDSKYILQRVNHEIFRQPQLIDDNINAIARYIQKHAPGYLFTTPVTTRQNASLIHDGAGYYRMFEFVPGSKTYDVVQSPGLAYEAAKQFGKFTRILAGFPVESLKITLPDFHNLNLRYFQFGNALKTASADRLKKAQFIVAALQSHAAIVNRYNEILGNPAFKIRVTHHDTKISNVLFSESGHGLCVIDLDTVMPGYFISDVGDMMRTYLTAAGEEETDFSKVFVREEYFAAIVNGYLSEMNEELTTEELNSFVYAGKFMIYMQALRFITDYLNNDVYYGARYELHNYNRAANQLALLESLIAKESVLQQQAYALVG